MVRHIVIWRLKEHDLPKLQERCNEFSDRLYNLKEQIPEILKLEVGINSTEAPAGNDDISLIVEFNSFEDLKAYQIHPAHQELVSWLREVRDLRAAVDYEF
jgi:hypothetical protein